MGAPAGEDRPKAPRGDNVMGSMSRKKLEWFKQTTWGNEVAESFFVRLEGVRSTPKKAEYLRTQAAVLEEMGRLEDALSLLDHLLENHYADRFQLAVVHLERARVLASLNLLDKAISSYRAALQAQRDFPNVGTEAWLEFAELIVNRERKDLYAEGQEILKEFGEPGAILFPVQKFQFFGVLALLTFEQGNLGEAYRLARQALEYAAQEHSGLRYHSTLGLVSETHKVLHEKLSRLTAN